MEFKRTFLVNKPIEQVWDILGNQFGQACHWASGVHHSEGRGATDLTNYTGGTRECRTDFGRLKERVELFDPHNYRLRYVAYQGFPFFVDNGRNTWMLTAKGRQTEVSMALVMTMKGLMGKLMSPVMKGQMRKAVDQIVVDFKTYAETGQASAHKQKELAKQAKKAA